MHFWTISDTSVVLAQQVSVSFSAREKRRRYAISLLWTLAITGSGVKMVRIISL